MQTVRGEEGIDRVGWVVTLSGGSTVARHQKVLLNFRQPSEPSQANSVIRTFHRLSVMSLSSTPTSPHSNDEPDTSAVPARRTIALTVPTSLLVLPTSAAIVGMIIGMSRGGSRARLRFLAENAHRPPTTVQGWVSGTVLQHSRPDADQSALADSTFTPRRETIAFSSLRPGPARDMPSG